VPNDNSILVMNKRLHFTQTSLDPFGNQDVEVTLPNCTHLHINESYVFFKKIDFDSLEKLCKVNLLLGKDEKWSLKDIGSLIETNHCPDFTSLQIVKDDGFCTLDDIQFLLRSMLKLGPKFQCMIKCNSVQLPVTLQNSLALEVKLSQDLAKHYQLNFSST
jgi:hypothetical protein